MLQCVIAVRNFNRHVQNTENRGQENLFRDRCVAVCCSVLPCVAMCCSVLLHLEISIVTREILKGGVRKIHSCIHARMHIYAYIRTGTYTCTGTHVHAYTSSHENIRIHTKLA